MTCAGWLAIAFVWQLPGGSAPDTVKAATDEWVYLSDVLCGICTYPLEYGKMLGLDATSYPLWPKAMPGEPLSIAGKRFAKGIGAPHGDIVVVLDGEYDAFEAEVGVQTGDEGTAYFVVLVDGKQLFESGEMRGGDAAKQVRVPLAGAKQMTLRAGSGVRANWANARLFGPPKLPNQSRPTWLPLRVSQPGIRSAKTASV